MARILLGWELGAGNGHTSRLLELAAIIAARGHEPLFAPQQIGPFAAHWPTWQAPVWPRLLEPLFRRFPQRPATMGDILAYLGLDDPYAMAAMILAWDRVILDAQPDAIIAEYAPMLQLAAKGRVPTLAFGTGFSLPPAQMPCFPSLFGNPAVVSEPSLLSTLNTSLRRTDRAPLMALPEIFAADHSLVATFKELDPYRQWRRELVGVPAVCGPVPLTTGEGEELFVYFNGKSNRPNTFWQGLVDSRLSVRVHDTILNDDDITMLEGVGIHVARTPIPFDEIVARSRLLISHGGLGFVSSALLAGLPQIIIPFDGEKLLTANAAAVSGACLLASFDRMKSDAFAAFLRAAWSDESLHARARAAAPSFRSRMTKPVEVDAVDIVETLL